MLRGTEVMIVTCESNPAETEALRARCAGCADVDPARWAILGHLKVGQAVALPVTEEAGGALRLFTIAPRLTPHVRHREKYVDVPVSALGRSCSTRMVNRDTGFARSGSSCPSWNAHRHRYSRGISCAATFRAGLGTCSAIARLPTSCGHSSSDIGPDCGRRRCRPWPMLCGRPISAKTNSRHRAGRRELIRYANG